MNATMKRSIAMASIVAPIMAMLFLSISFLMGASGPQEESWFLVAELSDLPTDGTPIHKTVSAKHFDAWTRLPDRPILDVFIRRSGNANDASVVPSWHHDSFRIPLRYDHRKKQYVSVCWNVAFDMQGKEVSDSESVRTGSSLTQLPVQVVGGDVWVRLDDIRH